MSILEREREIREIIARHEYNTLNLTTFKGELKPIIRDEDIILSLICLLFKFRNFEPLFHGILQEVSANSYITFGEIDEDRQRKKLFFKVVNEKQKNSNDPLIIDILNSILFNSLRSEYVPRYRYSSLTYTHKKEYIFRNSFWNYNVLNSFTDVNSPYYPENFRQLNNRYSTCQKAYIVVYDAINGKSVYDIFNETDNILKATVFIAFSKLFNFLVEIGVNNGFVHNDLHLSNIFFDMSTGTLKLIDFGRSSFDYEFAKTCQQDFLKEVEKAKMKVKSDNIYKTIFSNECYYRKLRSQKEFLGIISDLITISLNFYYYLVIFLKTEAMETRDEEEYNNFFSNFSRLLEFDKNKIKIKLENDDEILEVYLDILNTYVKNFDDSIQDFKDFLRCLLDGLLFATLFFRFCNLTTRVYYIRDIQNIIYYSYVLQINQQKLNEFISHIHNFLFKATIDATIKQELIERSLIFKKLFGNMEHQLFLIPIKRSLFSRCFGRNIGGFTENEELIKEEEKEKEKEKENIIVKLAKDFETNNLSLEEIKNNYISSYKQKEKEKNKFKYHSI
jgi:serine/threonine protein kinase